MTGKVVIKLDNINYQYALILLNYCVNPQLSESKLRRESSSIGHFTNEPLHAPILNPTPLR